MRDFSSREVISTNAEKSKRPPTRRNSRISLARACWLSIQTRSAEGASAAMRPWPSGEEAYPRKRWRSDSNSSTPAELWAKAEDIAIYVTGEPLASLRQTKIKPQRTLGITEDNWRR